MHEDGDTTAHGPVPAAEIDGRFSSPEATARPWPEAEQVIDAAEIFWLSTVRADGRPHVTPLPAMWLDGALHFCTGPSEQKARNLQRNPSCVLTTGTPVFLDGLDVVVEGSARRILDTSLLERLAAMWLERLEWPFEVVEGGFRDPELSAGGDDAAAAPDVAHVFAVAPTKILAFGKGEPFSQTRFTF
jgi:general stress protein 26